MTPISVGLKNRFVELHNGTFQDLVAYWYDTSLKKYNIEDFSNITFTEYDSSIVSIEGSKITALKEGRTI